MGSGLIQMPVHVYEGERQTAQQVVGALLQTDHHAVAGPTGAAA